MSVLPTATLELNSTEAGPPTGPVLIFVVSLFDRDNRQDRSLRS